MVPATAPLCLLPCAGLAPPWGVAAAVAGALLGSRVFAATPCEAVAAGVRLAGLPSSGLAVRWRGQSSFGRLCVQKQCVAARAVAGGHSAISLGLGGRVRAYR